MSHFKFEFPTEWSLCPAASQDEAKQPTPETNRTEQEQQEAAPREPRVLAAGGLGPSPQ
jgi:hypothetical protein